MSRPSFQFYHGDWISNAKLRRCTHEEKGAWIDILCLMADSDEFGVIRWPLKDLAQAVGARMSAIQSLVRKGVLKGADGGETCEPFIYIPRHGRKDGEPVTLIPAQSGPIWYSSKQVRDDHVAKTRAAFARTQGGIASAPKAAPKGGIGDGAGDVLPTPSPPPVKNTNIIPADAGAALWEFGITVLTEQGLKEGSARSFLGSILRDYEERHVESALRASVGKANAKAYIVAVLKDQPKRGQQMSIV